MENRHNDFHSRADWENKDVLAINREDAHTRWGAYENEEQAREGRYGSSSYMKSLNGTWQFKICQNPDQTDDFYLPSCKADGFAPVTVPGNWELQEHAQGCFDKPIYTAYVYPWKLDGDARHSLQAKTGQWVPNPPYVPREHNTTGCYRLSFTVPDSFKDREIFLRFEGVETVYYVWINGKPVGYSQDSKLPSEFNITSFVQAGDNLLAMKVLRFADSSYLEDQDYWYLCGIFRDVWLISKPSLHITDWKLDALPAVTEGDTCPEVQGTLSADISVSRVPFFAESRVRLALYDGSAKIAEGESDVLPSAEYRTDAVPTANTGRVILKPAAIHKWSPASPKLYTAVITLFDKDGKEVDFESSRIGFKKIEIRSGVVYFNGERLLIHGVNRHEHCWHNGRTVPVERMREEIIQMKRMNINAVRTSHYPDSPVWYELCDEMGILVVCETNLETHGISGAMAHNASYAPAFLERLVRMTLNYKNHVSIFSWSLGNESGTGANHAAMYGFIKEYDPSRICQYDAGDPDKNISDIRTHMYQPVNLIMRMLCDPHDDRPIILAEYLFQTRNAGGGLEHFLHLTAEYPRFQGGFVWDWQDKSLPGKTTAGTYFAYGGDLDEVFIDETFPGFGCCSGIVLPDLKWKPAAHELKQAYCPIRFERDKAWITKPNSYLVRRMTSLHGNEFNEDIDCIAVAREDGKVIAEKAVELPNLTIGKDVFIDVPFPANKIAGREYTLTFSLRLKKDKFYAPKGYEIGAWQFLLGKEPGTMTLVSKVPAGKLHLTEKADSWVITTGAFTAELSQKTGIVTSLSKNGITYLTSAGRPNFNRPYTGLDAEPGWGWYDVYEKVRHRENRIISSRVLQSTDAICFTFDFILEQENTPVIPGKIAYTFDNTGKITIAFQIHIDHGITAVPRVGVELVLAKGFEEIEYYGCGPGENYPDRMLSSILAVHRSAVTDQHFPFIPPSETGGHEQTRWLTLERQGGGFLRISSATPFHFDALHSSTEDYLTATHDHQLIRRPQTFVHIDSAHGPIGSEMGWSSKMPDKYAIGGGSYYLEFDVEIN